MPSKNLPQKGTQDPDAIASGYATNQSQPRRLTKASSAVVETNMVATAPDSRNLLAGRPSSAQSAAPAKSRAKKKWIIEDKSSATEAAQVPAIVRKKKTKSKKSSKKANANGQDYDYNQESNNSIEIQPREAKKKKEQEFDTIFEFFEEPYWKKGDKPNTQINYKCKWCENICCAHKTSTLNLKVHCDGSTQSENRSRRFPNQDKAKASGAKLPSSVAERNLARANGPGGGDSKQTVIIRFLQTKPAFFN
ncbi:hypothetical protein PTTG_26616 [Puccinia triticina 1-1 BBBD Race 1]|uniref:Uncharacterized protein n=1 Tax=Puccinia triticina (isolate 1-1 / race 1 (BBBD)) TaxID=630390 RepID=A0A180GSY4_PUCT1|nr:hypothetical protein PTTG_26616 [Puccinia triticina 1-1 BBBD Race 1]